VLWFPMPRKIAMRSWHKSECIIYSRQLGILRPKLSMRLV